LDEFEERIGVDEVCLIPFCAPSVSICSILIQLLPKSLITVAANSSDDNTLIGKAFGVTSRDERPGSVLVLNISDIASGYLQKHG
jgi:hypothetical protein